MGMKVSGAVLSPDLFPRHRGCHTTLQLTIFNYYLPMFWGLLQLFRCSCQHPSSNKQKWWETRRQGTRFLNQALGRVEVGWAVESRGWSQGWVAIFSCSQHAIRHHHPRIFALNTEYFPGRSLRKSSGYRPRLHASLKNMSGELFLQCFHRKIIDPQRIMFSKILLKRLCNVHTMKQFICP